MFFKIICPLQTLECPNNKVNIRVDPQQQQETLKLVDRNQDMFSTKPGYTLLIEHEIHTIS